MRIALLAVAGALLVPATGALAQERTDAGLGIRLAEAPVEARDDPRAQVYLVDQVEAGETVQRKIEITNGTAQGIEPRLYVAAAAVGAGNFAVDERAPASGLSRWSNISPARLELQGGERATATLEIDVPDDAEDGEYYGAALAEIRSEGDGGVSVVSRVGIRIYLAVGDEPLVSDFEITKLTARRAEDGKPIVTASVTNTGQRALDMSGDLELTDGPGGIRAGPFQAELGRTLAIGETQPVRVVLDEGTPAGPWEAKLTLRSGRIAKTVEGAIGFPQPGASPRDITFREVEEGKSRWAGIAAALLILVLLGLLVWLWKGRAGRKNDQEAERTAQVRP